jgi:hypothetical protein
MDDEFFFDPEQQEGSNYTPIPAGEYTAEIIEATITQPKTGDGHMLSLIWRVVEGDHEGRQIFQQLCYQHSNPTTQDIARRTLKDICTALDINQQVSDPEIFKFKPARVRVVVEVDKYGQYDDKNKVRRVKPLTDADNEAQETRPSPAQAVPTTPKPAAKPAPKAAGNGPGAAPWKQAKPAA